MSRTMRLAVLVLVLANLMASAAFALPRAGRPAPAGTEVLATAWAWLSSFLIPASPVAKAPGGGIIGKAGSRMDLDGIPHASTIYPGSTTDAGSQMDPNGFK
jgi:hypothetical protein